jgi:energy-coupling factor transport system ATP-binding protein
MKRTILEVEGLSFQYDKRKNVKTLEDVSFQVNKGEWVAVIGHNGCGKSTLAQLLVGLLSPDNGEMKIAGQKLREESKWMLRENIGIVFQNPENQFIGTTVQDDIAFGLENINMPYEEMKLRVDKALEMVEMSTYRLHDPSQLSGGQKQRVAIAGVLALKPSVLVLDEAFVMLDPKSRRELLSILQVLKSSEDIAIISITHDMEEAAKADRIMVMSKGKMVKEGSPQEIFYNEDVMEKPFADRLRNELKKRGSQVPDRYMTEDEMVRWLCKLN